LFHIASAGKFDEPWRILTNEAGGTTLIVFLAQFSVVKIAMPVDILGDPRLVGDTQLAEREQEAFLEHRKEISKLKLRWRSQYLSRFLHIIPGERILHIGAGLGSWTQELAEVLGYRNQIIAAVFSPEFLRCSPLIPNVGFVNIDSTEVLNPQSFDYVIGSTTVGSAVTPELMPFLHYVLKPGGQVFFFEPNVGSPFRKVSHFVRSQPSRRLYSRSDTAKRLLETGFIEPKVASYDILPWRLRAKTAVRIQADTVLLEHAPVLQEFASSEYVTARKPGVRTSRVCTSLAEHQSLYSSVSVVVPCYNEAQNIPNLVQQLLAFYGPYIYEILLVNDNSVDETVEIVSNLSNQDNRVKLVNRVKPNGVGRALQEGYRAASGRYILSMDCDFVNILPEIRGLFDVVAAGYDGAIGSRFSNDSVVINYPFSKMLCNRIFHVLIRVLIKPGVRDITNNLKLYRADILKSLTITSPHFSANLETGLKPLLAGYKVCEVPISWIDRTADMGHSSFQLRRVGASYVRALVEIWRSIRSLQQGAISAANINLADESSKDLEKIGNVIEP
jgi:hypothetical protein